ncbi:MAG: amidophosphoribosyltransferase [Deltaproteobacteria bacterium]|nr:MAG: amidophosphoribosyltransferase [Deltaproteobacteria bacterium]
MPEELDGVLVEECGVVATVDHGEASNLTYLGLHALQHRGQESVGIASLCSNSMHIRRKMGRVAETLTPEDLSSLPGDRAIGHVRYSTAGGSVLRNAQPIFVELRFGPVAFAHNGNLTNADVLRRQLESSGSIFHSTSDTEVIAHLVARSRKDSLEEALVEALLQVRGAYSLVVLSREGVHAVRDAHGVRPLVLGRIENGWMVASETSSLDLIRAEFVREIEPGELLTFDPSGLQRSQRPFAPVTPTPCIFELVYFARPDSTIFGRSVYAARVNMGRELARSTSIGADLVVPVPDSGVPAALGYSRESGVPFELGLIRSHYVGRTFIEPSSSIRHFGVKLKLNPVAGLLRGKRVVVVDDSVVRGTTSRKIVKMIREAGASEVHFRVASPPTRWPCFYGIDTPVRSQLIAATHSLDEIRDYITADSIGYLTMEGLRRACAVAGEDGTDGTRFCEACFSGDYPIELSDEARRSNAKDPASDEAG